MFNNEKYKIFAKYNQRITANGSLSYFDSFAFRSMFDGREYWDADTGEWRVDNTSNNNQLN